MPENGRYHDGNCDNDKIQNREIWVRRIEDPAIIILRSKRCHQTGQDKNLQPHYQIGKSPLPFLTTSIQLDASL